MRVNESEYAYLQILMLQRKVFTLLCFLYEIKILSFILMDIISQKYFPHYKDEYIQTSLFATLISQR